MILTPVIVVTAISVNLVVATTRVSPGPVEMAILCVLGLTPGIAIVIGQRLAARHLHTRNLILWLRRFHGGPLRGISFPAVLGLACAGLAIPITLQDDRYAYSIDAGRYRSLRFFEIVVPIVVATIVLSSFFFLIDGFYPRNPARWRVIFLGFIFVGFPYMVWMARRERSLGVLQLTSTNLAGQIRALLGRLCKDRRRVPGLGGIVVIKVPDECWREAVLVTLERCALVIIDVTELSDSLKWELSASVDALTAHRIILACAIGEMDVESDRTKVIQQAMTEVVGPELAATLEVFYYPEGLGKSRLFVPQTKIADALQAILRDRLLESSSDLARAAREDAGSSAVER